MKRAAIGMLMVLGCARAVVPASDVAHPEGRPGGRVTGLTGRPFAVRVSSMGEVFATQREANSVAGFRVTGTTPDTTILVGRDPGDVVFNRDGSRAFVSAAGGSLHVIDVAQRRHLTSIRIANNAYRLALTADDSRLFVTSTNGDVYAVDPGVPAKVDSVSLTGPIQGIAIAKSGKTMVVTSTQGGVWLIDPVTLRVLRTNVLTGALQDVAISADETEIYVANEKLGVQILDGATLARKQGIAIPGFETFGLALTPDDRELYLTSPTTGTVKIVERRTRTVLYTLNLGGTPRRIAFDPSGRTAFVANEANWVDVIK